MLLEHGLERPAEATRLDAALDQVAAALATPDRGGSASTAEFGDAVVAALKTAPKEVADA
jgi:isocitrate/isopropylmalate dehydrogenase